MPSGWRLLWDCLLIGWWLSPEVIPGFSSAQLFSILVGSSQLWLMLPCSTWVISLLVAVPWFCVLFFLKRTWHINMTAIHRKNILLEIRTLLQEKPKLGKLNVHLLMPSCKDKSSTIVQWYLVGFQSFIMAELTSHRWRWLSPQPQHPPTHHWVHLWWQSRLTHLKINEEDRISPSTGPSAESEEKNCGLYRRLVSLLPFTYCWIQLGQEWFVCPGHLQWLFLLLQTCQLLLKLSISQYYIFWTDSKLKMKIISEVWQPQNSYHHTAGPSTEHHCCSEGTCW